MDRASDRLYLEIELAGNFLDQLGKLKHRELLSELVEYAELSTFGGIEANNLDAAHSITNVEEAAGLAALAVDRERNANGRLGAEAIQHGAKYVVVIEAVDQSFVHLYFVGNCAVDDALV